MGWPTIRSKLLDDGSPDTDELEGELMPILYSANAGTEEGYPGIPRTILVDASRGAESLWLGHLEIEPGARVTTLSLIHI